MSTEVVDSIPRGGRATRPLALSSAQERMWIMEQLAHGTPTFTTPVAIRLHGPLDRRALARSLDTIVQRHEVLRTTVRAPQGQPLQFVADRFRLGLPVTDLTHLSPSLREEAVTELLLLEARTPLDISERVIRARLFRLAPDDHVLCLAVHHIAWDGWSTGVFYSELSHLYRGYQNGVPAVLPELGIQYADYALWQREQERSSLMDEHLAYWLDELGGGVPPLGLPADHRPGPVRSPRAELVEHVVAGERVGDLRAFARRQRVSTAMLTSAAMHAVLHRWTGRTVVASGLPAANREHPEVENLIGFFVNSVVLKTTVTPSTTFAQLLEQVRGKMLRAMRHGSLPFDRVVDALGVARNTSHNPFVQASLAFDYGADAALLDLPGLCAEFIELYNGTAQDDLGLFAWEQGPDLRLVAEFRTDLYEPRTAARFLHRVERAIEFGCQDPDRSLADLDILVGGERAELARLACGPEATGPFEPLHVLVERQAARTPEAVALLHGDAAVTYRELNGRANRMARFLRRGGVRQHDCVAVALERSIEATVAILAVMKAGALYVPLDPALPAARLELIVADTAPVAMVTSGDLRARLPGQAGQMVLLDDAAELIAAEADHNLDVPVVAEDVAYILYTSGSTGHPKGVIVPHRGVANLIISNQKEFAVTHSDRVLHGVPLTFDTSISEIFWPLAYGAAVVIAGPHTVSDPSAFAELLAGAGVTIAFLVPTLLAAYLGSEPPPMPHLRLMISNGEAFEPTLLRRFRQYAPQARVFNAYGPTEASIGTTMYEIPAGQEPCIVPIGLAMPGTWCHALDSGLDPVPPGAAGVLHIGGIGVTHGYQNRPGLTAEQFIPDPFSGVPGARLYRTGDVVRHNSEGLLEFHGRSDDQVKLHGVRVEPGEIQALLERDPDVSAARVVVRAGDGGRRLLVAYLTAVCGGTPDLRRLRGLAAAELPRMLVPSRFIVVPEFPLTSSGKLDVRQLPEPGSTSAAEETYVAPRRPMEHLVAEHVAGIVGLGRVGLHDDFFALGGNSLDGARLVFALRAATGAEVLLGDLFRASSVIGLAALLEEREHRRSGASPSVRLNRTGHGLLHLAPALSGGPFAYAELAGRLEGRIVISSLQVPGLDDDAAALGSIRELAETFVSVMRGVQPSGPYTLGGWSMGGLVALEAALLLRRQGEETALVLIDPTVLPPEPAELSDEDIAEMFRQEVTAQVGGAIDDAGQPLLERRLKVYTAAARAVLLYRMTDTFDGPALLLRPEATASGTSWDGWLHGPVRRATIPGDHYSLLQGDNARILADRLAEFLT